MLYIEALRFEVVHGFSLFLAGGITGCPDWQKELVKKLEKLDITIFNPRRKKFPIDNPSESLKQIRWEHEHLRKASAISFWFPCETICPIVLYELGAWSMMDKKLFVGVHPDYSRKQDVEIQTKFVRPDIKIVYDIPALAAQITKWFNPENLTKS